MEEIKVATLKAMGEQHLSIALVEQGLPSSLTLKKIQAEVNEDLVKTNKYQKNGSGDYIDTNTMRRLLNDAFDHKWSWEIISYQIVEDKQGKFVLVHGRLYLPGLGYRDAFGAAKWDKSDNSASFSAAESYAFKKAMKSVGFASNILDENWDEELYEEDIEPAPKKEKPAADKSDNKAPAKTKDEPKPKAEFTEKQKAAMAELKEIYNIETNKQLVGFLNIWNKDIKSVKDLTPEMLDEFLTYYDENEDEFEDFDPEEVA